MQNHTFFLGGDTPAINAARRALQRRGCDVAALPGGQVTHLVLPVPSFEKEGVLRGGEPVRALLAQLPRDLVIFGGNLEDPALEDYRKVDLLQDPLYLAENAAITAHCAVKLALTRLPATLRGCPVLVLGWGRIGKCLGDLLKAMGAQVTVAARKEADRAILRALGYEAEDPETLDYSLVRYRVIFNTVPAPVLPRERLVYCRPDCLKIDLASVKGIAGEDVLWARGLPGKDAPETSGELIARTAIRLSALGRD